jgi:hypothetical protein
MWSCAPAARSAQPRCPAGAGKSTLPFLLSHGLLRTIEVQGTTAGHLVRAVAAERHHAAAGAAPLVERVRQMASTRVRANDHSSEPASADCRFKQAITSRSRQGPPCLVLRPSQDGWVRSRRLARLGGGARACCTNPMACPDVLGGGHIGQRDRLERPETRLGQVRRARAKRWALAPASFAAPSRCSRAFPIQPRRD